MTQYYVGFAHQVLKDEILELAMSSTRHNLLICNECKYAWLTMETAKSDWDCNVVCKDEFECLRRRTDNVAGGFQASKMALKRVKRRKE